MGESERRDELFQRARAALREANGSDSSHLTPAEWVIDFAEREIARAESRARDEGWNAALEEGWVVLREGGGAIGVLDLKRRAPQPEQSDRPEAPWQGVETPGDAEGRSPLVPPLGDRPAGHVAPPAPAPAWIPHTCAWYERGNPWACEEPAEKGESYCAKHNAEFAERINALSCGEPPAPATVAWLVERVLEADLLSRMARENETLTKERDALVNQQRPPNWKWYHEVEAEWMALDGDLMCEAHPGLQFMHDDECPGPGMVWKIVGKADVQAFLADRERSQRELTEVNKRRDKAGASRTLALRAERDALRADVERLQRELTEAREEREKFRYCARVMCGAHIGQPQPACPVCERNALRARLAAAEALLLFLSRQDTMPPGFVQMIDGFLAQRPAAEETK
jgi:hypothetical protein